MEDQKKNLLLVLSCLSLSQLTNQTNKKIEVCEIGWYCTDNACCPEGNSLAECNATKRVGVLPDPVNEESSSPSSSSSSSSSESVPAPDTATITTEKARSPTLTSIKDTFKSTSTYSAIISEDVSADAGTTLAVPITKNPTKGSTVTATAMATATAAFYTPNAAPGGRQAENVVGVMLGRGLGFALLLLLL
jgi:hypothetical protein